MVESKIGWKGDLLYIFLEKEICYINADGGIEKLIRYTPQYSTSRESQLAIYANTEPVKWRNYTYMIKKGMGLLGVFSNAYSKLVRIDQNGNETIIYDATVQNIGRAIILLGYYLVLLGFVVFNAVFTIKKYRKTKENKAKTNSSGE